MAHADRADLDVPIEHAPALAAGIRVATVSAGEAYPMFPLIGREGKPLHWLGILMDFAAGDKVAEAQLSKFLKALDQLGLTQGRNIQVEIR
jgi:hypothetical protein